MKSDAELSKQEAEERLLLALSNGAGNSSPTPDLPAMLLVDYRKLEARYVCTAGDKDFICSLPGAGSNCAFRDETGTCHNTERLGL